MAQFKFPPRPNPRDLERYGPRFEVEIGPPIVRDPKNANRRLDTSGLKFSKMPALIDTGAGRTVITPLAVQTIGLPLIDMTDLSRAGGTDKVGVYAASIQFPRAKLAPIEVMQVVCTELPTGLIQCLIGRDIMARWLFSYDGRKGQWIIDEDSVAAWIEPPEDQT